MKHPIDRVGGVMVARGPRRLRFFTEGWGDEAVLDRLTLPSGDPDPIDVEWHEERSAGDLSVQDGAFDSPVRDLPEAAQRGDVRLIRPAAGSDHVCVLMAAWNDHDYRTRTRLARLLARRGIASALLRQPYYGPRRPDPAVHQPIARVEDFVRMGSAALGEGRSLLATFAAAGNLVGVSGYSMGGNMAALVSATTDMEMATAPLAASHSPAPVFLGGVLRGGIDWEALGGESRAAPRLEEVMLRASTLNVPPQPHTRHAVLVSARHDAYVPRAATEALHDHWPGSELRWAGGGHATLLWLRMAALAQAIEDSFRAAFS